MLVGVLTGDSLAQYFEAVRLAPVRFITPPMVWLTAPDEDYGSVVKDYEAQGHSIQVSMHTEVFRHLLNTNNRLPGFYAALVPADDSISVVRQRLGVKTWEEPFYPNMLVVHDGMQSNAVKQFCRSLSDSLMNKPLNFEVFIADRNNPNHETLFDNYNPEAQVMFGEVVHFS